MNLSLWDTRSDFFQLEHSRRPFPVMPSLAVKSKGEAPKCKTCKRFYECTTSHGTMQKACDRYERKKRKK